jgi:hypothetical protein
MMKMMMVMEGGEGMMIFMMMHISKYVAAKHCPSVTNKQLVLMDKPV